MFFFIADRSIGLEQEGVVGVEEYREMYVLKFVSTMDNQLYILLFNSIVSLGLIVRLH